MSATVLPRPSASTARPRPPRCLVCDRDLADAELATCQDVHAGCPAYPEVSFLEKVRAAAPVAGWPDGRASADLVCPRCAALVNDIVIYESRLADMTQQLVAMVASTMESRAAVAEAAAASSADKPKARRPRKATPKKTKAVEADAISQETDVFGASSQQQQESTVALGDLLETEDPDDPMVITDSADPEVHRLPPADTPKKETQCTWLVTTEPAGPSDGRPTCPFCHKQLASASSLHKHMQLHSEQRRFKCVACEKTFVDRRALRRHEVDHTGVRPFCCATCGKTLLSNHALRIHQRSHLGIKPAECHICNKKMASAQTLREHLRIHTGERPFSCEICGRTFRTERILTSHQRTHTGVRPHVCDVCGRAFSQRTPLTTHLRSHTAAQLEAVKRERIGRTAIRTAAGIFDAKDGRSVRLMPAQGAGSVADGSQQHTVTVLPSAAASAKAPGSASVTDVTEPTDAGLTLASLMPVSEFVPDDGGDGGRLMGQAPALLPDGLGVL